MVNIENGLTLTLEQKKDESGELVQPLTPADLQEFNDKIIRLFADYGLLLSRFGDIDKMQYGLCKQYKKKWQEKAFYEGQQTGVNAANFANLNQTGITLPNFVFDELNKD